jgi:plasmid stabilization system protein ParE
MADYRFTPEAAADLFEIWSYIAQGSVDAADRVESAVYDACDLLAKTPRSGQIRKHFTTSPVRFWTVQQFPNYLIVYRPDTTPIEIIGVLHGMRDLKRILSNPRS